MTYSTLGGIIEFLIESSASNKRRKGLPVRLSNTLSDNVLPDDIEPAPEETAVQVQQAAEQPDAKQQSVEPVKRSAPAEPQPQEPVSFEINNNNIIQAMVFSEILGKPKALRQRRWRTWS